MRNGSCSPTTVPGSTALPFVISTEAQRSGEICGSAVLPWKCFSGLSGPHWIISGAVEAGVSKALESQATALDNIERVLEERLESIEGYLAASTRNSR
jgi:hypothetical protein